MGMSARPQGACCANAEGTKEKKPNAQTSFIFMLLLMFMLSASLRPMLLPPELHQLNFRLLVGDDLLGQPAHLRVIAVQQERLGHIDGALMMGNHHVHEIMISVAGVFRGMHASVHD